MYKIIMCSFVCIILGTGKSIPALGNEFADVIYHGGTIITINDDQPSAEAVAVKDGKIIFGRVGTAYSPDVFNGILNAYELCEKPVMDAGPGDNAT